MVSQNLVNMAQNSHLHSLQHLLERSIWHAIDRASPDIFDGKLTLGGCNGNDCVRNICIIIENNVHAIMKNVAYKKMPAIIHNHFLATQCNCRAGCTNKLSPTVDLADVGGRRVICSHGMMIPVTLSLALFRGLAAHALSELHLLLLHDGLKDSIGHEELPIFQCGVSCLMKVASITETAMDPKKVRSTMLGHVFSWNRPTKETALSTKVS
jgi:hypothetical protein